jgi:hypothetical protein
MMMGPSAPKGPPEPIEIALESGFKIATFGSTLLPLIRMASIASGIPCPRMRSDPYRAMNPIISAPAIGTRTSQSPSRLAAGDASEVPHLWKKKRFVKIPINFSSAQATIAPAKPMPIANPEMLIVRGVVVKSPSFSDLFILPL